MKAKSRRWIGAVIGCALLMASWDALALGSNYPNDRPITGYTNWPKGMDRLVNATNRVHGFLVNAEDIFFFSGKQKQFDQFLQDYAKIDGVVKHKVVIDDGVGRAKSPWQKDEGVRCDWMIYGCPAAWKEKDAKAKGYILEIHIWREGAIKLEESELPQGILIERATSTEPDAAPEPPPAAAVLESTETMNPKPESEAPADGGGR